MRNGIFKFVQINMKHLLYTRNTLMGTDLRPKYIEKYSNTLHLLSLINDYNYITITGAVEM